jgi:sphingomyelin phosphodiesterase 2
MEAIGRRFAPLDLDVMAFQEVWTADAREILLRAGRVAGLANTWHTDATFGGSGLLVLSRLPILDVHFQRFTLRGRPERIDHGDYYGGKGFALIRLKSDAGPFTLINTHLHARHGGDMSHEYRAVRTGQIVELAVRARKTRDPIVSAGDFNFQEGQAGYSVLTGLTGFRDAAAEIDRRQPTVFRGNVYRALRGKPDRRIDYLFIRDGRRLGVTTRSVERVFDEILDFGGHPASYSNHAGVMADFSIGPRTAAPARPPDHRAVELASRLLTEGRDDARRRQRSGRVLASAGVGGAALALCGMRSKSVTRRGFLRQGLQSAGLVALTPGFGFSILSEYFVPDELAGFDALSRRLTQLDTDASDEAIA